MASLSKASSSSLTLGDSSLLLGHVSWDPTAALPTIPPSRTGYGWATGRWGKEWFQGQVGMCDQLTGGAHRVFYLVAWHLVGSCQERGLQSRRETVARVRTVLGLPVLSEGWAAQLSLGVM